MIMHIARFIASLLNVIVDYPSWYKVVLSTQPIRLFARKRITGIDATIGCFATAAFSGTADKK
jgi:hypothetical protein